MTAQSCFVNHRNLKLPRVKFPWLVLLVTTVISLQNMARYSTSLRRDDVATKTGLSIDIARVNQVQPSQDYSHARYFQVGEILATVQVQEKNSYSAYTRATVANQETPWFAKRKLCRETCCVETVAISLDQDARKLINAEDGRDLADLMVEYWDPKAGRMPPHLEYHASRHVPEAMLPCMLPGTIIFIQNDHHSLRHFWNTLRPKIRVPFVIVMAGTDGETPGLSAPFMRDPLLMKLFGTNPRFPNYQRRPDLREAMEGKYESILLGLSRQHGQERQMQPFLQLTNFTNPFADRERFNLDTRPIQFDEDIFVHFSRRLEHRQHIWSVLCPNTTKAGTSCHQNTNTLPIHRIYTGISKYRFGISPPGYGYDCYRTYELLLLGIIPVIEERNPESYDLFAGLPVVQMPNMRKAKSREDFKHAIENYIASDDFQEASFDRGWKRLFLQSTREQVLRASGRVEDILVDEHGREYYQAFHYTVVDPAQLMNESIFCPVINQSCRSIDSSWMDNPTPELSEDDQKWITEWEQGQNSR